MKKILIIALLSLFSVVSVFAQQLPEPMQPVRLVNDFASVFSPVEQDALERKLVSFADSTSTQIAVVTVADLDGAAISDYSARLFDKWGIGGNSDKNNGILILMKPKTASSTGQVFITTGYGVEGAVPDALAGRIVDYDILPSFRQGRFYDGIDKATSSLMALTKGEYTADEYIASHENDGLVGGIVLALFVFFAILLTLVKSKASNKQHTMSSTGDVVSTMILGNILFGGGSRGGGGFGDFSGGGGGFGGFGGGFSGGGGAGGSW